MEKKIWNWRQASNILHLLQEQVDLSAYSNKAVKFTPDDAEGIRQAFNMFQDHRCIKNILKEMKLSYEERQ